MSKINILFLTYICIIAPSCFLIKTKQATPKTSEIINKTKVEKVKCKMHSKRFTELQGLDLGKAPRAVKMTSAKNSKNSYLNPEPKDADNYLRATSGLRFIINSKANNLENFKVIFAQDSRSQIGLATFHNNILLALKGEEKLSLKKIEMIESEAKEFVNKYDNPNKDYKTVRKKYKRDYESIAPLPDGRFIAIGSASNLSSKGRKSFRGHIAIIDPVKKEVTSYDTYGFFHDLLNSLNIAGEPAYGARKEINIEGVSVHKKGLDNIIAFFHRSNMTKNGKDIMIEFKLDDWINKLVNNKFKNPTKNKNQAIQPQRIVEFSFGKINSNNHKYDITLNDALFGNYDNKASYLIPLSVETDYFDKSGTHQDGDVVFSGIALWIGESETTTSKCFIFQSPGDKKAGEISKYGKIEGLSAFNPKGKTLLEKHHFSSNLNILGSKDIDSELKPSKLVLIKTPKL